MQLLRGGGFVGRRVSRGRVNSFSPGLRNQVDIESAARC